MKIGFRLVSILLMVTGGVWFLQGVNILPGSFMTGQPEWAVYGALAVLAGIALLIWGGRGRHMQP